MFSKMIIRVMVIMIMRNILGMKIVVIINMMFIVILRVCMVVGKIFMYCLQNMKGGVYVNIENLDLYVSFFMFCINFFFFVVVNIGFDIKWNFEVMIVVFELLNVMLLVRFGWYFRNFLSLFMKVNFEELLKRVDCEYVFN